LWWGQFIILLFVAHFAVVASFAKVATHTCALFSHSTLATLVLDENSLLPGMCNSGIVTIDVKVTLFAVALYEFTLPHVVWVLLSYQVHANPVIQ